MSPMTLFLEWSLRKEKGIKYVDIIFPVQNFADI